jgi:acyl-CoA reductase-like NAD-dependent aldehyde dehydrogenase
LQKTEQQTYNNYIGGSWIPAENGNTYEIRNPADYDDVVGYFQESSAADALAAIRAAKEAAAVWRKVPPPQRGLVLYEAWNIMKQRAEDFARIITREEGKPLADSRGEVKRSLNVLEFMAGEGRRLSGDSIPSELQNTLIYTQKRPLGVVAVITPWNLPFTAVNLVKLFAEAGLPKGVLNLVTGPGGSVGKEIIGSEDVRAVSFTGSTETGRWIYESSSKTMKKVQCEMGGKNAVVVTENADLDLAVEGVVQGAFGSTGQRCTATSRVVVFESIKETFLGKLAERASRLKVGSGFDPATDVGPLASKSQLEKVMGYITGAKEEGAKLFHGGRRLSGSGYDKGHYVEPTIFDDVTPKMKIGCEEVFGPVLSILTAENLESAIELANDSRFGLSGSIYSSNLSEVMKYVDEIEVGMIHVNSPTLGGEAQAPFGGVKESGLGTREQGRKAVDFFTEEIVVYVDYTGKRRDAKFI